MPPSKINDLKQRLKRHITAIAAGGETEECGIDLMEEALDAITQSEQERDEAREELDQIKRQAEDATEYVLAAMYSEQKEENAALRARCDEQAKIIGELERGDGRYATSLWAWRDHDGVTHTGFVRPKGEATRYIPAHQAESLRIEHAALRARCNELREALSEAVGAVEESACMRPAPMRSNAAWVDKAKRLRTALQGEQDAKSRAQHLFDTSDTKLLNDREARIRLLEMALEQAIDCIELTTSMPVEEALTWFKDVLRNVAQRSRP